MIIEKPGKYKALEYFEVKGENGWHNILEGNIYNITQVVPEWPNYNWICKEIHDWIGITDIPMEFVGAIE